MQYAVVVFRLNIDYPNAITAVVSAASSLTWADALLGFSPACLAPGLGSGGQAAAQLLGSLLIPCGAVAASLGLWALRCGARSAVGDGARARLRTCLHVRRRPGAQLYVSSNVASVQRRPRVQRMEQCDQGNTVANAS